MHICGDSFLGYLFRINAMSSENNEAKCLTCKFCNFLTMYPYIRAHVNTCVYIYAIHSLLFSINIDCTRTTFCQ